MSNINGLGHGSSPSSKSPAGLLDQGTLKRTLAPTTSADFFKASSYSNKPKSGVDIGRFLSREGRVRQPSSLKASAAEFGEDLISLGTGRPSPNTYPFEKIEFVYSSPTAIPRVDDGKRDHKFHEMKGTAVVYKDDPSASIDLSIALSYGYSLGSEQLIQYLTTHVSHFHSPPYSDWEICLTGGNTSALETMFRNFANPGDFVLVEEYTYSGTIEAAAALGLTLVPVAMDADGMSAVSLDQILSNWGSSHPGIPAPRLLYVIPTGQNPTGITQPRNRRQEILNVAEKHDLLIVEDDPYYYLQFPNSCGKSNFSSLPSYLSLSQTGRVVRLDSTSKILAPGLRLGWLTAPKRVVETFQAAHDLGFVHPSGLSQLIVYKLVSEMWGHGGFEQWLNVLAGDYHYKATAMLQAMERELGTGVLADVCSWANIQAGMFIWLRIDCTKLLAASQQKVETEQGDQTLLDIEDGIHKEALKQGVLTCKGSFFSTPVSAGTDLRSSGDRETGLSRKTLESRGSSIFLRLTFASSDEADIAKAIGRLGVALRNIFSVVR